MLVQGRVIYDAEESAACMHLQPGGGAVMLTNPDGSTQLVLLTADQRNQIAAAESWRQPKPVPATYSVRCSLRSSTDLGFGCLSC